MPQATKPKNWANMTGAARRAWHAEQVQKQNAGQPATTPTATRSPKQPPAPTPAQRSAAEGRATNTATTTSASTAPGASLGLPPDVNLLGLVHTAARIIRAAAMGATEDTDAAIISGLNYLGIDASEDTLLTLRRAFNPEQYPSDEGDEGDQFNEDTLDKEEETE